MSTWFIPVPCCSVMRHARVGGGCSVGCLRLEESISGTDGHAAVRRAYTESAEHTGGLENFSHPLTERWKRMDHIIFHVCAPSSGREHFRWAYWTTKRNLLISVCVRTFWLTQDESLCSWVGRQPLIHYMSHCWQYRSLCKGYLKWLRDNCKDSRGCLSHTGYSATSR